jgi:serine/threonine protein phosphatase 1
MTDCTYYAIGDVHGELDKLERLLEHIDDDARRLGAPHMIIQLGDLVDRGPDSRGVVERMMRLEREADGRAVVLRGNHEEMMVSAYASDSALDYASWAVNGGRAAIESYERANGASGAWREAVDVDHIRWLQRLPVIWREAQRGVVFVHAGIDPWRFPHCSDEVRIWTRSRVFLDSERWPERKELEHLLVVHGHTPTEDFEPDVERRRINVDTGACFGGPLTCVVLAPDEGPRFLRAA